MKRLLNSIITALGAVGLFAVVAPSEAAAQQCRSSSSYGYSSGRHYTPSYTQTRQYVAPVRRYTSSRVVVNPHYGNGSIYYRAQTRAYPQQRYVRTPRKTTRYRTTRSRSRCR